MGQIQSENLSWINKGKSNLCSGSQIRKKLVRLKGKWGIKMNEKVESNQNWRIKFFQWDFNHISNLWKLNQKIWVESETVIQILSEMENSSKPITIMALVSYKLCVAGQAIYLPTALMVIVTLEIYVDIDIDRS